MITERRQQDYTDNNDRLLKKNSQLKYLPDDIGGIILEYLDNDERVKSTYFYDKNYCLIENCLARITANHLLAGNRDKVIELVNEFKCIVYVIAQPVDHCGRVARGRLLELALMAGDFIIFHSLVKFCENHGLLTDKQIAEQIVNIYCEDKLENIIATRVLPYHEAINNFIYNIKKNSINEFSQISHDIRQTFDYIHLQQNIIKAGFIFNLEILIYAFNLLIRELVNNYGYLDPRTSFFLVSCIGKIQNSLCVNDIQLLAPTFLSGSQNKSSANSNLNFSKGIQEKLSGLGETYFLGAKGDTKSGWDPNYRRKNGINAISMFSTKKLFNAKSLLKKAQNILEKHNEHYITFSTKA